jgi:hypothetical protein
MSQTLERRSILRFGFGSVASAALLSFAPPAHAAPLKLRAELKGSSEVPPNETTGTGTVTVTFDPTTRRLTWDGTYSGLTGPATGAYFQGPAEPGKNAGVVVTITPATNQLKGSVTLTDTQAVNLMLGHWYVNIYTDANKGGELRGQLVRMQVRN